MLCTLFTIVLLVSSVSLGCGRCAKCPVDAAPLVFCPASAPGTFGTRVWQLCCGHVLGSRRTLELWGTPYSCRLSGTPRVTESRGSTGPWFMPEAGVTPEPRGPTEACGTLGVCSGAAPRGALELYSAPETRGSLVRLAPRGTAGQSCIPSTAQTARNTSVLLVITGPVRLLELCCMQEPPYVLEQCGASVL